MNEEPNVFTRAAQICDIVAAYEGAVHQFDSVYDLARHMERNEKDKAWDILDPSHDFFLSSLLIHALAYVDWYSLAKTAWINAGMNETED